MRHILQRLMTDMDDLSDKGINSAQYKNVLDEAEAEIKAYYQEQVLEAIDRHFFLYPPGGQKSGRIS